MSVITIAAEKAGFQKKRKEFWKKFLGSEFFNTHSNFTYVFDDNWTSDWHQLLADAILNRLLTHARFVGAHNLCNQRRLAHTCFSAYGPSGGGG